MILARVAAGAMLTQERRQRVSALFDTAASKDDSFFDGDEVAAVERAISNVEQDIAQVTTEIEDVKRVMRSGEEYLGMQGKDLIGYLSKQLKKEEQLRKKEEQLRDEKSESACLCS